ncbi:MAG: BamA/TamA family outer membrane protein [Vicinamibacterales bacterium]
MARGPLALLIAVLLSAPAAAQSTRVEAIAEQQAEKAKALEPEGPNPAERVIVQVMNSPLFSGEGGAYPWFGSVYGGSGFSVGAGYLRRLPRGASANAVAGISMNSSHLLEGRFTAPELWHGALRLDGLVRRISAREVDFFGYGPDSSNDGNVEYDFRPTEVGLDATLQPGGRWFSVGAGYARLGIRSNYDTPNDADDEPVIERAAPGVGEPLDYNIVRATAAIDWRTSPGYSTRGGLYRVRLSRHRATGQHAFSFKTTEWEVVQLAPLVREQFVFAFRGLATFTTPDAGHAVPVMLAPFLGNGSTLRGFVNHRFTDRHRVLLTGEYRWRPSRYLDMALFLDAGQVAAERRAFRLGEFETSWGLGARFHGPAFNALRIEVARGREGMRLIVGGAQAF